MIDWLKKWWALWFPQKQEVILLTESMEIGKAKVKQNKKLVPYKRKIRK